MLTFRKTRFAFNFHCNSHSSILIPSLTKWKILAHQQKIYSVVRKKSRRSLRNYWKSISVFSTTERTGTRNTQNSGSSQNPPTPKMSVLFKNGTNIKIGYFGKLEFLDNQTTFTEVFGDKPTILVPNIDIYQDSTSIARRLYSFGEKCNLDVFLYMCRKYYVGHDSIDNLLSVQDVCRQISEIKQEWKNKNGILMQYSPDKLFDKFLRLSSSLPESARAWPVQLCSTYFTAPSKELVDRMLTGGFQIPLLVNLNTKSKQLAALKEVRMSAST